MNLDKAKLQQLIIMMPIILVAGVFCYIKFLSMPLSAKMKTLKNEMDTIKQQYQESQMRVSRLPKLQQEIAQLNLEIQRIEKKLPKDRDVPGLIRLLSKKMDSYHIYWQRLVPGPDNAKEHYVEHLYSIPFHARYHDLAEFLTEMGGMERIFQTRFSQLNILSSEDSGVEVKGELTLLIYTAKS